VELFAPTTRWPSLAPAGKHVVVARAQFAPYTLKTRAWDKVTCEAVGHAVDNAIGAVFRGFADTVVHREVLSPADLERKLGVTQGALTHGELTLDQILFMRPVPGWAHYATSISGLYFGGSGAHPGPGVLGGAGLLAAKRALARR
jgi:phytoene dehydrogenase-like protein